MPHSKFWQRATKKLNQTAMPLAPSDTHDTSQQHTEYARPRPERRRSRSHRVPSSDRSPRQRSYHESKSPARTGSARGPDSEPASPGSGPISAADTLAGQLIAQALANGQLLPHERSGSPSTHPFGAYTHQRRQEVENSPDETRFTEVGSMHISAPSYAASKASTDSGISNALDRWSQRRLQRLNTEQGFREQRQGSNQSLSSPSLTSDSLNGYHTTNAQPQPTQHGQYPNAARHTSPNSTSITNNLITGSPQPTSDISRPSTHYQQPGAQHEIASQVHVPSQQAYSPPDAGPLHQTHARPNTLQQSRSFNQTNTAEEAASVMSIPGNNAPLPAPKPVRSNRQSMHNGVTGPSPSAQQQAGLQAPPPPPPPQHSTDRAQQPGNIGRATPQPLPSGEDMTEEDVTQLVKDHKELREKYTKVKKYYFEKEDQVKQLQNSLAHQRLAQSRTSLDDSEYSTRFNRLDGLIAQLAFGIRKNWKTIPLWLGDSVNKDAIQTGKQEMTAAGRAFISCWLIEEIFDKYFHPDLDRELSVHLKTIQRNIRRFAPPPQTAEDEDFITAKVVNWRLTTLEGLQEVLHSSSSTSNRVQLMELLKSNLIDALQLHLENPPMSDLEGGVHMIIELSVSMATHLPLESRDVQIEYFKPGTPISTDMMKMESGIPTLGMSVAEDSAERTSHYLNNAASSDAGGSEQDASTSPSAVANSQDPHRNRKRDMLSAFTGTKKASTAQGKHAAAGASTGSLSRPESAGRDDSPPRVRMAVGLGAQVRGKTVLVKAPIFST